MTKQTKPKVRKVRGWVALMNKNMLGNPFYYGAAGVYMNKEEANRLSGNNALSVTITYTLPANKRKKKKV